MVLDAFFGNQNVAFGSRLGDNGKTYSCIFHQLFECFLVFHLDQDTRDFGKQNLDNVLFRQLVEVHFQTAFHVGETHFEQCRDHTTGRNVVSGENQPFLDGILYGVECVGKIFAVFYRRDFVTQFVQNLCKSGTAQLHRVEREVNIIYVRILFVGQYRRYDLANVADFCTGRNNHRTRSNHFVVAIFLCHGQRVFTGRDIDAQCTSEVRSSLDRFVQAGILAFVTAWPHPVGTQRYT